MRGREVMMYVRGWPNIICRRPWRKTLLSPGQGCPRVAILGRNFCVNLAGGSMTRSSGNKGVLRRWKGLQQIGSVRRISSLAVSCEYN